MDAQRSYPESPGCEVTDQDSNPISSDVMTERLTITPYAKEFLVSCWPLYSC